MPWAPPCLLPAPLPSPTSLKGFAYLEFLEKDAVDNAVLLDNTELRGRNIKVQRPPFWPVCVCVCVCVCVHNTLQRREWVVQHMAKLRMLSGGAWP